MHKLSGSRPLVNARLHLLHTMSASDSAHLETMKHVSDCFQRFELLGKQVRSANNVVRHVRFF